jgi:hypothetical protein
MSNEINYSRLSYLGDRVKEGKATKEEKDEYMQTLYNHGNITKAQYDKYLDDKNSTDVVNTALSVGALLLIGYIISKMFKDDD